MAGVRLCQANLSVSVAASTSRRWGIAGNCDIRADTDTLNDRQILHRTAGTLSRSMAIFTSNTTTGGTSTVIAQKGGVDSTISISVSSGSTGLFEDLSHTEAVAAGDKWCQRLTTGTGGSVIIGGSATTFTASDGTTTMRVATGFDLFIAATNRNVYCGSVANNPTSTDSTAQCRANWAGSWKNMSLRVGANSHTTTFTTTNRINGSAGTLSIAVTTTSTGDFEDLSHSDTVAAADLICIAQNESAGSGNYVPNYIASDLVITSRDIPFVTSFDGQTTIASGLSNVGYAPGGRLVDLGVLSSRQELYLTGTAENLGANLTANTLNNNLVYTLYINGSSTALTVTVSSTSTGQFNDLSHQVSVVSGDDAYVKPDTSAAGSGTGTQKNVRFDVMLPAPGGNSGSAGILII